MSKMYLITDPRYGRFSRPVDLQTFLELTAAAGVSTIDIHPRPGGLYSSSGRIAEEVPDHLRQLLLVEGILL